MAVPKAPAVADKLVIAVSFFKLLAINDCIDDGSKLREVASLLHKAFHIFLEGGCAPYLKLSHCQSRSSSNSENEE